MALPPPEPKTKNTPSLIKLPECRVLLLHKKQFFQVVHKIKIKLLNDIYKQAHLIQNTKK